MNTYYQPSPEDYETCSWVAIDSAQQLLKESYDATHIHGIGELVGKVAAAKYLLGDSEGARQIITDELETFKGWDRPSYSDRETISAWYLLGSNGDERALPKLRSLFAHAKNTLLSSQELIDIYEDDPLRLIPGNLVTLVSAGDKDSIELARQAIGNARTFVHPKDIAGLYGSLYIAGDPAALDLAIETTEEISTCDDEAFAYQDQRPFPQYSGDDKDIESIRRKMIIEDSMKDWHSLPLVLDHALHIGDQPGISKLVSYFENKEIQLYDTYLLNLIDQAKGQNLHSKIKDATPTYPAESSYVSPGEFLQKHFTQQDFKTRLNEAYSEAKMNSSAYSVYALGELILQSAKLARPQTLSDPR